MTNQQAIEYINSLMQNYDCPVLYDNNNHNYRLCRIWLSDKDMIALNMAKEALRKLDKIEQLVNYWDDYNSYDSMLGIKEVLEKDKR